jgi:hypothetical protein
MQIAPAGRDQRLVLVQGDGAGGAHGAESHPAVITIEVLVATTGDGFGNLLLGTGDIWQAFHVFG